VTKDDEAYSARQAIACSVFGRRLAKVYPDRAEKLIDDTAFGMGLALESAMRVEITAEVEIAARAAGYGGPTISGELLRSMLTAAFRAAGFEVVT
jgi:hypothetical protein